MRNLPGCVAVLALCGAALPGCQDAQARRRAEIQDAIAKATAEMRAASVIPLGSPANDGARQKLTRVIADLSAADGGEPGQQAAVARLTSGACRMLASMDLVAAAQLESENRLRRSVADGMIDAAIQLDSGARALEAVSAEESLSRLEGERRAQEQVLMEWSAQVAALDGPVAELNRQNRSDRAQADRLRDESDELRRTAADLGPALGYGSFEEGLRLDREADRFEHAIARRELQLRFELQPDRQRSEAGAARTQALLDAIQDAQQSLATATLSMHAEAEAARKTLDQVRASLQSELAKIDQATSGPLDELYERASSNLQKAASKADGAARLDRTEAESARIEAARAWQALGDLYRARAAATGAQVALLERMAAAPGAVGSAPKPVEPGASYQDLAAKAKEAYTNAQSALGQVTVRTSRKELDAVKAALATLLAESAPPPMRAATAPPAVGAAAGPQGGGPPAGAGAGAESPQALLSAITAASGLEASHALFTDYTYVELKTADYKVIYEAIIDSNAAAVELERALQAKFGSGMMDLGPAMGGGMMAADFAALKDGDLALGPVAGNRGTINLAVEGRREQVPIIRVGQRWYLDGTAQFAAAASMGAETGGGGTPQQAAAFMQSVGSAMAGLAGRVSAGEFASLQEAMTALGQEMQRLMPRP